MPPVSTRQFHPAGARDPIADLLARAIQEGQSVAIGDRATGSYPLSPRQLRVAAAVVLTTELEHTPLDDAPGVLDSWPLLRATFERAYHGRDPNHPGIA